MGTYALYAAGFVVIGLLLVLIVRFARRLERDSQLKRAGLADRALMTDSDILRYLERQFTGLGYRVERAGRRETDTDLVVTDGAGQRTAVIARFFLARVDGQQVQDAARRAAQMRGQQALLVSTEGFTANARRYADMTGALLWGPEDLAAAAEQTGAPQWQAATTAGPRSAASPPPVAATVAATVAPEPPKHPCPICGAPMKRRRALDKDIRLCSRFPRCNGAELLD